MLKYDAGIHVTLYVACRHVHTFLSKLVAGRCAIAEMYVTILYSKQLNGQELTFESDIWQMYMSQAEYILGRYLF